MKIKQLEPKSYSSTSSRRSTWTSEEDEKLSRTLHSLEQSQQKISWATLKKQLQDLNKTPKQIRERWTQQLSHKIINCVVLKEHEELIIEAYQRSLRENKKNRWKWISDQTSEIFQGRFYPPNSIKNLINRRITQKKIPALETLQLQRRESFDNIEIVLGPEFDSKKN